MNQIMPTAFLFVFINFFNYIAINLIPCISVTACLKSCNDKNGCCRRSL